MTMVGNSLATQLAAKQPLSANLTALAALASAPFDPQAYDAYAAGTVYSLTNTAAALTFGTTQPSVTVTVPGTYRVRARAVLKLNGATFAAVQAVTLKLRRTNNTAADLANGSTVIWTGVASALTGLLAAVQLPEVLYTTLNSNDALTLFGSVAVAPSLGSLDVTEASIHLQRVA